MRGSWSKRCAALLGSSWTSSTDSTGRWVFFFRFHFRDLFLKLFPADFLNEDGFLFREFASACISPPPRSRSRGFKCLDFDLCWDRSNISAIQQLFGFN